MAKNLGDPSCYFCGKDLSSGGNVWRINRPRYKKRVLACDDCHKRAVLHQDLLNGAEPEEEGKYKDVIAALTGKTIQKVQRSHKGDVGLKITTTNRETLEVAFSACEGFIELNGKYVEQEC